MVTAKSIMPVLTSDRGYWTVRVRLADGSESFLPPTYTMLQAQVAADSIRRTGVDSYRGELGPLAAGVRIVRS